MPESAEDIKQFYKEAHDVLTKTYYADPDNFPGGKKAFDEAHAEIWTTLDAALVAAGHMAPPGPSLEDRVNDLEERIKTMEFAAGG